MISGRVIDAGLGIASGYASKLLYEAGLEVVKLEPALGDPLRSYTASTLNMAEGESGALFKFLHQGKKSVTADSWPNILAGTEELLTGADILIESFSAAEFEHAELLEKYPSLVILSITPWGKQGSYAEKPATEFTIQAESGALDMRAHIHDPPVRAGGQIIEWAGGAYGAVAALGALYGVRKGTSASSHNYRHIDLSLLEVGHMICSNYADLSHSLLGNPEIKGSARAVEMPEIHPTSDGYVGFTANSRQQFQDFLVLIEKTDWLDDEHLASYVGRRERKEEFTQAVNAWTSQFSQDEVVEKASAFRIPVTQVLNGKTLLSHPHLRERNIYKRDAEDKFFQPRRPWLVNGKPDSKEPQPAPALGEHTGKLGAFQGSANMGATDEKAPKISGGLPLEGLTVLDITCWWAGPAASQMLGNLGADVIHLESANRPDGIRMTGGLFAGQHEDWWERSMFFLHANINKRGLALNLASEEGAEIARELIKRADVIMENFTPRVMDNFNLGFEEVRKINPSIVYIRMPAFGLSGPWRNYPGFAQTMEQISGMAWVTGHEHDQPHNQRGPSDPNAGMHAAFAALVGLLGENKPDIEVPMVESALNASAELVLEYSAYGNLMEREGNRSPYAAPQNIYMCKRAKEDGGKEGGGKEDEEKWLAISVVSEEQWKDLKRALKNPKWAETPELDSHQGRRANQDLLDEELAKWAQQLELEEALELLWGTGVPAGRVRHARYSPEHPQHQDRRYYEEVDHPAVGRHLLPTVPFRLSGVDTWIQRPAPTLGQHSEEIFKELGLSDEEIAGLEQKQVTGKKPIF